MTGCYSPHAWSMPLILNGILCPNQYVKLLCYDCVLTSTSNYSAMISSKLGIYGISNHNAFEECFAKWSYHHMLNQRWLFRSILGSIRQDILLCHVMWESLSFCIEIQVTQIKRVMMIRFREKSKNNNELTTWYLAQWLPTMLSGVRVPCFWFLVQSNIVKIIIARKKQKK